MQTSVHAVPCIVQRLTTEPDQRGKKIKDENKDNPLYCLPCLITAEKQRKQLVNPSGCSLRINRTQQYSTMQTTNPSCGYSFRINRTQTMQQSFRLRSLCAPAATARQCK